MGEGREGGREGGRKKEGGREGGREGREGGRGRERGREGDREGGSEREGERERERGSEGARERGILFRGRMPSARREESWSHAVVGCERLEIDRNVDTPPEYSFNRYGALIRRFTNTKRNASGQHKKFGWAMNN